MSAKIEEAIKTLEGQGVFIVGSLDVADLFDRIKGSVDDYPLLNVLTELELVEGLRLAAAAAAENNDLSDQVSDIAESAIEDLEQRLREGGLSLEAIGKTEAGADEEGSA